MTESPETPKRRRPLAPLLRLIGLTLLIALAISFVTPWRRWIVMVVSLPFAALLAVRLLMDSAGRRRPRT